MGSVCFCVIIYFWLCLLFSTILECCCCLGRMSLNLRIFSVVLDVESGETRIWVIADCQSH